jgi:hypothetical protein
LIFAVFRDAQKILVALATDAVLLTGWRSQRCLQAYRRALLQALLGLRRCTVWFAMHLTTALPVWMFAAAKSVNGLFHFVVTPTPRANI